MKLPRDLSGGELARALTILGYNVTRQTGSHIRLTTIENGEHHVTVPAQRALPLGTLRSILKDVARHFELRLDELAERLFDLR